MSTNTKGVYAWIYLDEDNPGGTNYNDANSCYQTLRTFNVYRSLDMVNICFFGTVPVSGESDSFTIEPGNKDTVHISQMPGNNTKPTTQDYMQYVIRDGKAANPHMKFLATLGYADDVLSKIFNGCNGDASCQSKRAETFANNLVSYLQANNLDGFDVDWEGGMIYAITPDQFTLLFQAIRKAFDNSGKTYYLIFSPAGTGNMVGSTVNNTTDWLNLQVYGGATPGDYTGIGINSDLLAYGAKFESENSYSIAPHQTPQDAYNAYLTYTNTRTTQWRLNSGNYQSEQAYQIIYSQLIRGTGMSFDDTDTMGAAGNPLVTHMLVRHGDVLNAVQNTNTGPFTFNGITVNINYEVPQHGGDSGEESTFDIDSGDALTEVTITTGTWFGWNCVVQLSFKSQNGKTYGPFGTMAHASNTIEKTYNQSGKTVVAFKGTLVNVPLSSGPNTDIVAELVPVFA